MPRTVTAVIPTLNEAETIAAVIAELPRGIVHDVIIADSGSHDGTPAIARAAGARVISLTERGYGRACAAAARHPLHPTSFCFSTATVPTVPTWPRA